MAVFHSTASSQPADPFDRDSSDAQLRQILRVLRERWWVLLLLVALGAGAAYAKASQQPSRYRATATLLYNPNAVATALRGNPDFPDQPVAADPVSSAATVRALVLTRPVRKRAERSLGVIDASVTTAAGDSDSLFHLSATATDPQRAATIANTWAKAFVDSRADTNKSALAAAIGLLESELEDMGVNPSARPRTAPAPSGADLTPAQSLQRQLQSLRIAEALQQSDVQVAENAAPPSTRTMPRPFRDALIGGVAGLLFACVLLAATELLDRRLKTVEEVEAAWDAPLLAAVPPHAYAKVGAQISDLPVVECFRLLQANLSFLAVSRVVHTIAVTSPVAAEGKSTAALGLASTLAASGRRVLLVDADFRKHRVTSQLELQNLGLSNVLAGNTTAPEAITLVPVRVGSASGGSAVPVRELAALSSGPLPPNPFELLASDRMRDLLRDLKDDWEHVVIDCAPMLPVSDTIPLLAHVDGVLVAQRLLHSRSDTAKRSRDLMRRADARILGVALALPKQSYGYGYGYGYAYGYGYDNGKLVKANGETSADVAAGAERAAGEVPARRQSG